MTTLIMSTIKLPLGTDDAVANPVYEALESLVNGEISPTDAARKVDSIIITDLARADSESHALGWEQHLWDTIGRSAMVIPAEHPGQEKLIEFLQDIQKLPRTTMSYSVAGVQHEKVFWSLTASNHYANLAQWLWELNEGANF
jgi:hypothetical protein